MLETKRMIAKLEQIEVKRWSCLQASERSRIIRCGAEEFNSNSLDAFVQVYYDLLASFNSIYTSERLLACIVALAEVFEL